MMIYNDPGNDITYTGMPIYAMKSAPSLRPVPFLSCFTQLTPVPTASARSTSASSPPPCP